MEDMLLLQRLEDIVETEYSQSSNPTAIFSWWRLDQMTLFLHLDLRSFGMVQPLVRMVILDIPNVCVAVYIILEYIFYSSNNGKFIYVSSYQFVGCGGELNSSTGAFASPNYPQPYHHNSECIWKISVSKGSRIQLIFVDINLESSPTCR